MSKAIDLANTFRRYATFVYPKSWRASYARNIAKADTHSANLTELSENALRTLETHGKIITANPTPMVMMSNQAKNIVAPARAKTDKTLETEYNRLFLNVKYLQSALTDRINALSPEKQEIIKKDPNYGELDTTKRVLEIFAKKPPKSEIHMQSYLERLRVYQANLQEIEKSIVKQEGPKKPKTGISRT